MQTRALIIGAVLLLIAAGIIAVVTPPQHRLLWPFPLIVPVILAMGRKRR